jgi:hypothetical protein
MAGEALEPIPPKDTDSGTPAEAKKEQEKQARTQMPPRLEPGPA